MLAASSVRQPVRVLIRAHHYGAWLMLATLPFTTSHAEWIGLIVGIVSLIGIGGVLSTLICHRSGCWRRGRFRYGHYRLCHKHHPDVPSDGKIDAEHIAAAKPAEKT